MVAREHIFGTQHFRVADFAKRDSFHVGGRARDRESSLCRSFFSARQGLEEAGFFQLIVERWVEKFFGFVTLRSRVGFGHRCYDVFRGLVG
jgi:hypothetical protein